MPPKLFNMKIQDILTASNGDDVWFAATNPIEGAMADAFNRTEQAILNKSLQDAEAQWKAARLKSIALDSKEEYPPRTLPLTVLTGGYITLACIAFAFSSIMWHLIVG